MQTFLPYSDFDESARCLDRQRLGKQRVEVVQLLAALSGARSGWSSHPAARMWRGYEGALAEYGIAICSEWKRRGYKDTCEEKIRAHSIENPKMPSWLGDERFHASHRSNLLRKNPDHYGLLGWSEPTDLPYFWPSVGVENG